MIVCDNCGIAINGTRGYVLKPLAPTKTERHFCNGCVGIAWDAMHIEQPRPDWIRNQEQPVQTGQMTEGTGGYR